MPWVTLLDSSDSSEELLGVGGGLRNAGGGDVGWSVGLTLPTFVRGLR